MALDEEIIRKTISLCPECLENIPAEIYWDKKENKIFMRKECPKHGPFMDRLSSNPEEYIWQQSFTNDIGSTVNISTQPIQENERKKGCPYDCGLCTNHLSAPCICLIDLTNRCNLRCPVCFANSAATGYVYEPTFEEVVQIMTHFRNLKPVPAVMLQLSGGEPTLREDLIDIIKKGKELGFTEVMLTTNGIRIAKSLEYTKQLKEAGCDAVYLSFDGVLPETWKKIRGVDLSKIKIKAIENCRDAKIDVALVPTVVNGVNDHEVGNILEVAKKYAGNPVMGVIFQPVALTGRISIEDLNSMRYTTSDLKDEINRNEKEIVFIKPDYWTIRLKGVAEVSDVLELNGAEIIQDKNRVRTETKRRIGLYRQLGIKMRYFGEVQIIPFRAKTEINNKKVTLSGAYEISYVIYPYVDDDTKCSYKRLEEGYIPKSTDDITIVFSGKNDEKRYMEKRIPYVPDIEVKEEECTIKVTKKEFEKD